MRDIKTMFAMGAAKKKKADKDVSVADDELLGDILNEMHGEVGGPKIDPCGIPNPQCSV